MKLYVCWGKFPVPWPRRGASWKPAAHPCKRAYDALKEAGYSPQVVRVYSFGQLPDITRGRKEVKRLTGESFVPVLVVGDGQVVKGSDSVVDWARANPAGATANSLVHASGSSRGPITIIHLCHRGMRAPVDESWAEVAPHSRPR